MSILSLKNITYAPTNDQGFVTTILEDVSLNLEKREIIALLGRSGAGKSTLLRIIAGLIEPTSGEIIYNEQEIQDQKNSIAMVFQTFALFPWFTVKENIEIVLKAQNLEEKEMEERIHRMIEVIGLQGCENMYPRELSGGMRQRVGFARALAIHPKILLLDEPFSALDIITAQNLRTDFLDLWHDENVTIENVILVTHSIEEAILLADRIKIFNSSPGSIGAEIEIKLPHPRDRLDPAFKELVEEIYDLMFNKLAQKLKDGTSEYLPKVSYIKLYNFLDFIISNPYNGTADLPDLAAGLDMAINDLFPIIDALKILKFAELEKERISVTSSGKIFVNGDQKTKRNIFSEHLIQYVPFMSHIRRTIQNNPKKESTEEIFLEELEKKLPRDIALQVMKCVISWGRASNLFIYDDKTRIFHVRTSLN